VSKVEDKKRTYSLNQGSYLIMLGYPYEIKFDEETARFYLVFPQEDEVKKAIQLYKSRQVEVNLFDFTKAYKKLRDEIRSIRFSSDGFAVKYSLCKIKSISKNEKTNKEFVEQRNKFLEEYYEENYFDGVRVVDEDEFN
jgi:hypothetical protein